MEPRKTYEAKRVLANLYHDAAMQALEKTYKASLSTLQRLYDADKSALNALYETVATADKEEYEKEHQGNNVP